MRFSLLYEELKFSDVFKSCSDEEYTERLEAYSKIKLKEALDKVQKRTLPDGTLEVRGDLNVSDCGLRTLRGLNVSIVIGDFNCVSNEITSLEGAPNIIDGDFYCNNCFLKTLAGGPSEVTGEFNCSYNDLTSLKGAPKKVGEIFDCQFNTSGFTREDVEAVCEVNGRIWT